MMVPIVENPRRRKKRVVRRKKRRYVKRRRRNPLMATLGNPKRRRRTYRKIRRRRTYRRRNPGFNLKGFDFQAAAMVGVGMIGSDMIPMLIRKFYPALPSSGIAGYAVKLGGTFVTAHVTKMVTNSQKNFQLVMAGGIALVLVDLFRQYVAPNIGLSGMGGYDDPVAISDLTEDFAMNGYVDSGVAGYEDLPIGAY